MKKHIIKFGVQRKRSITDYNARGLYGTAMGRPRELGRPEMAAYVFIAQRRFTIPRWVLATVFRAMSNYRTQEGRLVR